MNFGRNRSDFLLSLWCLLVQIFVLNCVPKSFSCLHSKSVQLFYIYEE